MSNPIKTLIDAYIRRNGRQEITGEVLNAVLKAMVDDADGQIASKRILSVDLKAKVKDYGISMIDISEKYTLISVIENGLIIATILPSTDTYTGWMYEFQEGWRMCKVWDFAMGEQTWENLCYYLDEHSAKVLADAPSDGKQYARQSGAWAEVQGLTPDQEALIDTIPDKADRDEVEEALDGKLPFTDLGEVEDPYEVMGTLTENGNYVLHDGDFMHSFIVFTKEGYVFQLWYTSEEQVMRFRTYLPYSEEWTNWADLLTDNSSVAWGKLWGDPTSNSALKALLDDKVSLNGNEIIGGFKTFADILSCEIFQNESGTASLVFDFATDGEASFRNQDNDELIPLDVADPTRASHAATKDYVDKSSGAVILPIWEDAEEPLTPATQEEMRALYEACERAVTEGKSAILNWGDVYAPVTLVKVGDAQYNITLNLDDFFTSYYIGLSNGTYYFNAEQRFFIEERYRTQSISGAGSTSYIPSTKAVVDYVGRYHDDTKADKSYVDGIAATKADKSETYTKGEVDALIPSVPTAEISANTAARHTHGNKGVLDGITSAKVTSWDGKQEPLIAGANISIADDGRTISATGGGGGSTPLIDNLTSDRTDAALTARQGKVLKGLVDGKQDIITDLATIRSGASLGATALQSVPNTYRTATDQDAIDATKQDIIADLATIRAGATLGSTALQSVPSTYRTAAQQDAIHDATKQDVIGDLASIRSGASKGATAVQPSALAPIATSGSYDDLSDKPTIPTKVSDLSNDSGFVTSAYHDATKADASALSALDTRVQALEADYLTALNLL